MIYLKFLFLISIFIIISCSSEQTIKIKSINKLSCVTIITKDDIRYVIAGESNNRDTNYVKLNISNIPELGDGIWTRWLNDGWVMVIDKSIILENKLDTSKFHFNNNLPIDKNGLPTEIDFRKDNCAIFDFYSGKLTPNKGATIEIN